MIEEVDLNSAGTAVYLLSLVAAESPEASAFAYVCESRLLFFTDL